MNKLREHIATACHILVKQKLDSGPFGNISIRIPGENQFLVNPEGMTFDQITEEKNKPRNLPNSKFLFFISGCLGLISGIMGLGGGVFIVPYLSRHGIPIRNAIAISAACILPVAVIGVIGALKTDIPHSMQLVSQQEFFYSGFIYWPAFLGISITSLLFAPLGIKAAQTISTTLLKNIFAFFIMCIGIKMIY